MSEILIELAGSPGSGKTFLARHLGSLLTEAGLQIDDRSGRRATLPGPVRIAGKVADALYAFFRRDVRRRVASLMDSAAIPPGTRRRKICFNWYFVCGSMIRSSSRGAGVVLMDQGPVQALWSLRFPAERDPDQARCAADVADLYRLSVPGTPILIARVGIEESRLLAQLETRPDGRSAVDADPRGTQASAARALSFMDGVVSKLGDGSAAGVSVISLRNDPIRPVGEILEPVLREFRQRRLL